MNVVTNFRNQLQTASQTFNQEGDGIALDARRIRQTYVNLEILARNLVETTQTDLSDHRHQRQNLRRFMALIPRMVAFKNEVNQGLRRLIPRMTRLHNFRWTVTSLLTKFEMDINMSRRKLKEVAKEQKADKNQSVI